MKDGAIFILLLGLAVLNWRRAVWKLRCKERDHRIMELDFQIANEKEVAKVWKDKYDQEKCKVDDLAILDAEVIE